MTLACRTILSACMRWLKTLCIMLLQLMPESLFLTINLIDRYLAVRQVTRKNLQLVSVLSCTNTDEAEHTCRSLHSFSALVLKDVSACTVLCLRC